MTNLELRDFLKQHVTVHARTEESQQQFFYYLGDALDWMYQQKVFNKDANSIVGIMANLMQSIGVEGGGRGNIHGTIRKLEITIWRLQRVGQDCGSIGFVKEETLKEFLRNLRRASLKPQIDPEDSRIVWVDSWIIQAVRAHLQNSFDMPLWQYLRKMKPKVTQPDNI